MRDQPVPERLTTGLSIGHTQALLDLVGRLRAEDGRFHRHRYRAAPVAMEAKAISR